MNLELCFSFSVTLIILLLIVFSSVERQRAAGGLLRFGVRKGSGAGLFALPIFLAGCSTAPIAPANLSQPGWKIQQGQAVWRAKKDSPEIAGELLLATRPGERTVVQFTKTPFPFVVAQITPRSWQLEIPARNKTYSAPGKPPNRIAWFHLPDALKGIAPPKPWYFSQPENQNWRLENRSTGEMIEGFLNP